MLELASIVLLTSIIVFFSQEFGNMFKKFFAIRGMKLFVPLILASALVVNFEPWILAGLLSIKRVLHAILAWLQSMLPAYSITLPALTIILLLIISITPVMGIDYWIRRKSRLGYRYKMLTSLVLWLFAAILLTVSFSY